LIFTADVTVGRIQGSLASWTASLTGTYVGQSPDTIEITATPYTLAISANPYTLTIRAN
jgi:hypothetical protein